MLLVPQQGAGPYSVLNRADRGDLARSMETSQQFTHLRLAIKAAGSSQELVVQGVPALPQPMAEQLASRLSAVTRAQLLTNLNRCRANI